MKIDNLIRLGLVVCIYTYLLPMEHPKIVSVDNKCSFYQNESTVIPRFSGKMIRAEWSEVVQACDSCEPYTLRQQRPWAGISFYCDCNIQTLLFDSFFLTRRKVRIEDAPQRNPDYISSEEMSCKFWISKKRGGSFIKKFFVVSNDRAWVYEFSGPSSLAARPYRTENKRLQVTQFVNSDTNKLVYSLATGGSLFLTAVNQNETRLWGISTSGQLCYFERDPKYKK